MNTLKLTLLALPLLTGCQVASSVYQASTSGSAFSCEQIRGAFSAYEADRQSADAIAELGSMIHMGSEDISNGAITTSDAYYERARENANIALIVQGCPPL